LEYSTASGWTQTRRKYCKYCRQNCARMIRRCFWSCWGEFEVNRMQARLCP